MIDGKMYDVFDISKSRSQQLKSFMSYYNGDIIYDFKNLCVNMNRIDNICINHSKNIEFNYVHKFCVHSYVITDDGIIMKSIHSMLINYN